MYGGCVRRPDEIARDSPGAPDASTARIRILAQRREAMTCAAADGTWSANASLGEQRAGASPPVGGGLGLGGGLFDARVHGRRSCG
ncbi:hypothetical protein GCM10009733_053350 [Nonomuraea maheshkhaliensis]|uniref:Uncharacterized protein n=1 Tax=Nonomuraea maheshkhaliensis TaxID=419590 RepID=A0ABP4RLG2_9ACTN